ncbi:hypothetical protein K469DRAFT_689892 [Zopfia rhizophila CBS 207.26]|uniref:Uncharacterized protein n=1 Tax=Zopfia rhizophila CBS 207.26 TaxID=1314779 RepID=A0A6A6DZY0_9PEZI|nr:hypothetical protein K469DRAFT_689892 [Zopfia rhizophila CBS 207.26]
MRGKDEEECTLQEPYWNARADDPPVVQQELDMLYDNLAGSFHHWGARLRKDNKDITSKHYNQTLDQCYERFQAIIPSNVDHPTVNCWMKPWFGGGKAYWEILRASALATRYARKSPFVLRMAGKELAFIKTSSDPHARTLS